MYLGKGVVTHAINQINQHTHTHTHTHTHIYVCMYVCMYVYVYVYIYVYIWMDRYACGLVGVGIGIWLRAHKIWPNCRNNICVCVCV